MHRGVIRETVARRVRKDLPRLDVHADARGLADAHELLHHALRELHRSWVAADLSQRLQRQRSDRTVRDVTEETTPHHRANVALDKRDDPC